MTRNFKDAAIRHFSDADYLFAANRKPNAGQLYGFCAECGIKALLILFGLPIEKNSGDLLTKSQFKMHINGLIANLYSFVPSDRTYFSYLGMIPGITMFRDWSVDHRYFAEPAIPQSYSKWKIAAQQIRAMMDRAVLDGRM